MAPTWTATTEAFVHDAGSGTTHPSAGEALPPSGLWPAHANGGIRVIGNAATGIGICEDATAITRNSSCFVPLRGVESDHRSELECGSMRYLLCAMLVIVGSIHLQPITGVLGNERLAQLYGMAFTDPNLSILMRHRAVLFGLLGGFLVYAAFRPDYQPAALLAGASSVHAWPRASVCYGTAESGRLENGVSLPLAGVNFASHSALGWALGRAYLHSTVRALVLDTYAQLAEVAPDKTFVFGETGGGLGGRFPPHKTHQNGLSVDFMVPVMLDGRSVPLPTSMTNQFGYGIEFDDNGRWGRYHMDFEALAEHLYQLSVESRKQGVGISRVIFEVPLQQRLWKTARGSYLRENLKFSTRRAWVRHDEHYHVDFLLACKPR